MNLSLSDDQRLLQESFARLFAREATMERGRAAADGFDPGLWRALVDMGAPMVRVPQECGGLGLSLLDAVIIAEEAGRSLACAPLIEVIVTARLLAELAQPACGWLERIARGCVVVMALEPAVAGMAAIVPGGAVAEAVVALDGDELVLAAGRHRADPQANSGTLPIASWRLAGDGAGERIVLASGRAARSAFEAAVAEWRLLSAACLGALARQALADAAAYACERKQFGRPVGSFQGLAHPLADAVTEVEGARLLVRRAITAIAESEGDAAGLVALAWWWAQQASSRALRRAIRALGGYGLSLEYDLHLYHRRGTALLLLGGDPEGVLADAGDHLFGGARQALPGVGEIAISFAPGAAAARHAEALQAFFRANWDARMRAKGHHSTASHDAAFHRRLAEAGLIFGGWAAEHGNRRHGSAEDFAATLVFEEWNYTSHVVSITNMIGQVVMQFGSDEAKAEILPRIRAGEAVCSLGFSEPGSGSDVFAARTTAVRDGHDWIIDGQKMFTTAGHYADYVLLLTRSDPSGTKHQGLTLFAVPTALPGYEAQAVHTYQDERTNITFYTGMRVPDRYRLGEVGAGAAVMSAALALEHGGSNYYSGHARLLRNALAWAETPAPNGIRPLDRPGIRARLARIRARAEISLCFVMHGLADAKSGHAARHAGSMAKLFITESFLDNARDVLEMGGPEAILTGEHPLGMAELDHRRAYGTTIYGGTSEIHRSVVAKHALGLPKSRS